MKLLLAAVCLAVARADLPIHCVHDQIMGKWKLSFTEEQDSMHNCGYRSPDTNAYHFNGYQEPAGLDHHTAEIEISHTASQHAHIKCINGCDGEMSPSSADKWTLVYDEGLHFHIGNRKMFAFFEYGPRSGVNTAETDDLEMYNTDCSMTRTGWYHTNAPVGQRKYGCFKAQMTSNSNYRGQSQAHSDAQAILSPTSGLMEYDMLIERRSVVTPDALFRFNKSTIDRINSDPSVTWKAAAHPHMDGKITHREAYRKLGRTSWAKPSNGLDRRNYHHTPAVLMETMQKMRHGSSEHDSKKSGLPANFDWRDYVKDMKVVDQGDCGSCYAVASSKSFAMRQAIKAAEATKGAKWWQHHVMMEKAADWREDGSATHTVRMGREDELSSGDVLSCSSTNQGCAGGYPFLVGWFGQTFGMQHQKGTCNVASRNGKFATDYQYVGGYYGAATEEKIMHDLYHNGPSVIAIDAPSSLFSYSEGVFQCDAVPHEGTNLPDMHAWEKTNHALVATGWGEENGQKYWVIMNSWGRDWGDHGFFKLERTHGNNCAIDSMPVTIMA